MFLIFLRDVEGVVNLLINVIKCLGKMGILFNLDGFEVMCL